MAWHVDAGIQPDATIHIWPDADTVSHDLDHGPACACGPYLEEQPSGHVLVVHHSLDGRELTEPKRNNLMTWSARFTVQDISDGPAPIDVLAIATVEDGTLTQNTEHARSMELLIVIDADETSLKPGDVITASGHFVS